MTQFTDSCNEPAFPVPPSTSRCPKGMTLLDYFAGQVIGELVAVSHLEYDGFGKDAYKVAAQMVAERERRRQT